MQKKIYNPCVARVLYSCAHTVDLRRERAFPEPSAALKHRQKSTQMYYRLLSKDIIYTKNTNKTLGQPNT